MRLKPRDTTDHTVEIELYMVWSVALNSLCKHRYVSYQVSIVLSRKQPVAEC